MKITNAIRESFTDAVMSDVPVINYDIRIQELFQKEVVKNFPPLIKSVYDDNSLRGCLRDDRSANCQN